MAVVPCIPGSVLLFGEVFFSNFHISLGNRTNVEDGIGQDIIFQQHKTPLGEAQVLVSPIMHPW